ncbi:hypothetical protein 13VV501A_gene0021 [Vibrio phage 13VV501A]|nr:hypothetical protein 13VV501A_gene0021 [Vibrio phage 13VV501A]
MESKFVEFIKQGGCASDAALCAVVDDIIDSSALQRIIEKIEPRLLGYVINQCSQERIQEIKDEIYLAGIGVTICPDCHYVQRDAKICKYCECDMDAAFDEMLEAVEAPQHA